MSLLATLNGIEVEVDCETMPKPALLRVDDPLTCQTQPLDQPEIFDVADSSGRIRTVAGELGKDRHLPCVRLAKATENRGGLANRVMPPRV
jgi:hypothetical protein